MKYIFFILLSLTMPVSAKKLYKYQDENGHWHYTDQKPGEGQEYESRQLKSEPKRHVWLEKSGTRDKPEFTIRNTYYGPIEVEISFTERQNARAEPELPHRFVVEPGASDTLFSVTGASRFESWRFTLQYRYTLGDPAAKHRADTVYLPPVEPGKRFRITQAFGGDFSHHDEQNHYAVDIDMPIDTPVHAARAGVVMDVENDYFKNGTERAYKSRANSIRILHVDGSMAVYAHLALEKAQVYPGMRVEAGQLIGYSGNTGFSTGPHLHFAVQVNRGMQLSSVPFKFANDNGAPSEPRAGMWLSGLTTELSR
ncbi:peptidoglycan DD-metalloendopeptidase family protein [Methylomarinum vadi]|uniref:peptidoglycan DD-metalloendopeptidase family protein n=1 Tax=Methylomarinum vadi TaxID=438855 RepID=UPI0004DFA30B|nr:peptidoglycan DD-metalloendopeptidase family protein [Methylomarinum vadi]